MSEEILEVDMEEVTAGELQISSETMTDTIENIASTLEIRNRQLNL